MDDCTLSDAEFSRISDLVYEHCGINLQHGKKPLVQARISKRMRAGQFGTVSQFLDYVQNDKSGQEFTDLIDSLSTNLTSFFRENQHFQYLTRELLPKISARCKESGRYRIRTWSAACSSGEEPYTLGITLSEALQGSQWDIKILATDICTRVLKAACDGVYDERRVAPVSPELRSKYMTVQPLGGGRKQYVMSPSLKEMIRFRHLNLMENWPFTGPFDFIFCRNVMIYFDKPTQEKLVSRFWNCLAPGGVLFTGHSESLTGINHRFNHLAPTIYGK